MEGYMEKDLWTCGSMAVELLDRAGNVKGKASPGYSWLEWKLWRTGAGRGIKKLAELLGSDPWPELSLRHLSYHVVTWDWTYLLNDVVENTEQWVQVGNGVVNGADVPEYKTDLRCKRVAGIGKLDAGYPHWNAEMEAGGAVDYLATFPAGTVSNEGPITEVCVRSGSEAGSTCLVYGRLVPGVEIKKGEGLRIWLEITTVPVEILSAR
jgi:hypothetical protein